PVQETFDFTVVVRRAQISVLHGPAARPTAPLLVDIERGAQRRAGVTRRRLHPYTLEWAITAEPGVHYAIERHAARHRQVPRPGLAMQPAGHVQRGFLQYVLQRTGEVHVVCINGPA